MKLKFGIEHWDAWMPGIRHKDSWRAKLSSIESGSVADPFADVEYQHLKPKQRRRLSDISKITLDVAFEVMGGHQQIPTVFASRRGEVNRMAGLLRDICAGDEASPMAFSLSVHNTASGLFSIQSDNQAPSTAIAAGHDTVAAALIEACSQLACGQERVLLVISEDRMPEIYRNFAAEEEQPVAAAFMLTNAEQFNMEAAGSTGPAPCSATSEQVSLLINLLLNQQPVLIAGERMPCLIRPA